jgi:multidrug efflux pump
LTLSPALAAVLLKPRGAAEDAPTRFMHRWLGWLFDPFNRLFGRASNRYGKVVTRVTHHSGVALAAYAVLVVIGIIGFSRVPKGFVPSQDKRYLVAIAQLPDAASLDRTEAVIRRMSDLALQTPGVEHAVEFPGLSISSFGPKSNAGVIFFGLKPFEGESPKDLKSNAILMALNQVLNDSGGLRLLRSSRHRRWSELGSIAAVSR